MRAIPTPVRGAARLIVASLALLLASLCGYEATKRQQRSPDTLRACGPMAAAPAPATAREARLQPATAGYSHPIRLAPRGDNWIALRSLPSGTEGMRVMKLGPDALFTVTGRQGTWLNVCLRSGETGWLHSAYVGCCRAATPY